MSSPTRDEWLSITPEPERDLPAAIATLRAGAAPSDEAVEAERARAEQLVLRGSRRRWLAWLHEAVALADAPRPGVHDEGTSSASRPGVQNDLEVAAARELVLDVIDNHDALELGLPGHRRASNHGAEGELFERIRTRNEKGTR
jgi:hypothetical protein